MERKLALRAAFCAGVGCSIAFSAQADLISLTEQLDSPIEIAAARANQAVYDALTNPLQNGGAICDPLLRADPGQGRCTGQVFQVFSHVRELVQNANELTGGGPTAFSLGLDARGLGFALRWTAAEEIAAQGTSATQFSGSQLNSLASRLTALRFGARGFRVARSDSDQEWLAASGVAPLGGGASADSDLVKRWGGFLDGSFGYGRRDDTSKLATPGNEDAFDYDGYDVTGGLDYRFNDHTVAGVLFGFTHRRIDFDSSASVVDGSIKSRGESLMFYSLWESDAFFASGSLGLQKLGHDFVRRINYPSINPLIQPIDETALSSTDSSAWLGSFSVGYDLRHAGFTLEPYLRADYQKITIDAFTEHNASGFDLHYGEQHITSLDAAFGLRMQYAFTPSFGVIVPFVRAEAHKDLRNKRRTIDATYSGVLQSLGLQGPQNFALQTDKPDQQFYVGAAGFSLVFKHGLQAFLQYQKSFAIEHIDDQAIAGGLRLEF
ncbi:MAG TPA: autotransporter outer membrane beta-barrel domain-containing protein [Steroidobacteraceae bacterium]|nr:autotransporter outer membrane beta-barrel domain-containing protein [Steroidobacteraceae bacterium]